MQCPICNIATQHMMKGVISFKACPRCGGAWLKAPDLERVLDGLPRGACEQLRLRTADRDEIQERNERAQRSFRRARELRSNEDDRETSRRVERGLRDDSLHHLMGTYD